MKSGFARWTVTLSPLGIIALAACQTPQKPPVSVTSASAPVAPNVVANEASFPEWLDGVRKEARARGIGAATIERALGGLSPDPQVIAADRRQPEFSQTFWRYIDNSVSDARVAKGRLLMAQNAPLLTKLERTYSVPGRYLVAFWAMESDFGRFEGDMPVVRSLATLAFDGRRGPYFRGELFDALTILDRGEASLARMTGSWAGAMGQTQFMPSTYLKYAVDEDGDGRRDIWTSVPDALGSTANYLKGLGWDGARGWGQEVLLPPGFDLRLASLDTDANETVKSVSDWRALGVRAPAGRALPTGDLAAALILPAGIDGPAFLVHDNYRAILKFNRSALYAIAVGYLADRLGGGEKLAAPRRQEDPIPRQDIVALQTGLAALGYLQDPPDGVAGAKTRRAVRAFQEANGLPPDGYIDARLAAAVKAKSGTLPAT